MEEMRAFSKELYPTVRDETFFAPCGVADLIATCYGGRNRLVAMEYTRLATVGRETATQAEADSGVRRDLFRACHKTPLGAKPISRVMRQ